MEKKINNILFLTTNEGTRLTFKVLFTYHSDNLNKDYAVFYNENDENHLLAYCYDENITLSELATKEEIEEIQEALRKFDEEQNEKQGEE